MNIVNFFSKLLSRIRHIRLSTIINQSEPHIESRQDYDGNSYWQVYDFSTNKSTA